MTNEKLNHLSGEYFKYDIKFKFGYDFYEFIDAVESGELKYTMGSGYDVKNN